MTTTPGATRTEEPPVRHNATLPEALPKPQRPAQQPPPPAISTLGSIGTTLAGAMPARGAAGPPQTIFSASLPESSLARRGPAAFHLVAAALVHAIGIIALILLPLCFVGTIELEELGPIHLIAAPPPPPPPPPPLGRASRARALPKRVPGRVPKLLSPTFIPARVAVLREVPPPEEAIPGEEGVEGGVPGGVPGGVVGGVPGGVLPGRLGGILGSVLPSEPPPPAPPSALGSRTRPLRVGGDVKGPQLIYAPQPVYPSLAMQARVEGDVVIEAVIDSSGAVVEEKVISGHPLLVSSALAAVQQWKYQPTYLNGDPVAVRLRVIVTFELAR